MRRNYYIGGVLFDIPRSHRLTLFRGTERVVLNNDNYRSLPSKNTINICGVCILTLFKHSREMFRRVFFIGLLYLSLKPLCVRGGAMDYKNPASTKFFFIFLQYWRIVLAITTTRQLKRSRYCSSRFYSFTGRRNCNASVDRLIIHCLCIL